MYIYIYVYIYAGVAEGCWITSVFGYFEHRGDSHDRSRALRALVCDIAMGSRRLVYVIHFCLTRRRIKSIRVHKRRRPSCQRVPGLKLAQQLRIYKLGILIILVLGPLGKLCMLMWEPNGARSQAGVGVEIMTRRLLFRSFIGSIL